MLNRSRIATVLSFVLAFALVLSGCTESKSPKESLQKSMEKSADIKSYDLNGSLKIQDLKLPEAALQDGDAAATLGMLQNAELSWTGAYRADPMLIELNMKISTSGDLAMSFTVPIIMNKEKMWIRVPNIPMLGLPSDIVGKFIEFDMKKLAEEQGTEWPTDLNVGKTMNLANDVYGIVFKHIDEKTYLSEKKAKDVGIPEDKKLKQIVQLHVTKDQVEPFVNTVIKDIAPEVIELLAKNEEYRKLLQLEQKDLDEAKKQLAESKDQEVKDALAEFNKSFKSLDAVVNFGIDGDGYASYNEMTFKGEVEEDGQSGSGTIKVVSEMTNINKDPKFEVGEPKADQIVPMDKLTELLGGMFLGGSDFSDEDLGADDESAETDL